VALPSSRVSLAWAQEKLFPEAEAGKRIVICMRSATYWGLETGRKYKGTLFAPPANRGGHLLNGPTKKKLFERFSLDSPLLVRGRTYHACDSTMLNSSCRSDSGVGLLFCKRTSR
jgi:hypothetical protein